jgi:hypothetical protein
MIPTSAVPIDRLALCLTYSDTTVNCHVKFSTVDFSQRFGEMKISMSVDSIAGPTKESINE